MRFTFNHLYVALLTAFVPPTFAQTMEVKPDEVYIPLSDLPVDGSEQALQLQEIREAGALTCNEPSRDFFASVTTSF